MQAGKVDVVAAILQSCSRPEGSSKKELQKMTKFGTKELDEYLKMMEAKDLITTSDSTSRKGVIYVKITERGKSFLDLYGALKMKYLTTSSDG
jgi:predicted transcriptional regulator